MYRVLNQAKLKTGEAVEIGLVLGPDSEHAEQIKPFLAHKGSPWNWHVARALEEDLDGLQTRFYVAKLQGEIAANVMTVEHGHAGIVGHVFTRPEHRRKGAISRVFDALMPDFQQRGGVLVLGTGYDSAAYWIYHSYGFRSVVPDTGFMRFATEEHYERDRLYVDGAASVRPVLWRDWPRLAALAAQPSEWRLRNLWLGFVGQGNFEGAFLRLRAAVEKGQAQCVVLETDHEAVAGYATLVPDARWKGHVHLLDVDVHPRFARHTVDLLNALPYPQAKVQCHVDRGSPAKALALGLAGFRHEATLEGQLGGMDVLVYRR